MGIEPNACDWAAPQNRLNSSTMDGAETRECVWAIVKSFRESSLQPAVLHWWMLHSLYRYQTDSHSSRAGAWCAHNFLWQSVWWKRSVRYQWRIPNRRTFFFLDSAVLSNGNTAEMAKKVHRKTRTRRGRRPNKSIVCKIYSLHTIIHMENLTEPSNVSREKHSLSHTNSTQSFVKQFRRFYGWWTWVILKSFAIKK